MPRITDIFILKELRKASLLLAIFQICGKQNKVKPTPTKRKPEEDEKLHFKLNTVNHPGSIRLQEQVSFQDVFATRIPFGEMSSPPLLLGTLYSN